MDVIVGSSQDITVEASQPQTTIEVTSSIGKGAQGDKGDTGGIVPITVSATPPASPNVNDLWIDIS